MWEGTEGSLLEMDRKLLAMDRDKMRNEFTAFLFRPGNDCGECPADAREPHSLFFFSFQTEVGTSPNLGAAYSKIDRPLLTFPLQKPTICTSTITYDDGGFCFLTYWKIRSSRVGILLPLQAGGGFP